MPAKIFLKQPGGLTFNLSAKQNKVPLSEIIFQTNVKNL